METELREETATRDVELLDACAGCGGRLLVRLSPGTSRAVCLGCHAVTGMMLVRLPQGVTMVQAPVGVA